MTQSLVLCKTSEPRFVPLARCHVEGSKPHTAQFAKDFAEVSATSPPLTAADGCAGLPACRREQMAM